MFDVYKTKYKLIRIGAEHDGGYVVPELDGFDLYIGGGVGSDYTLEDDYDAIKHFNIKDYKVFDGTTQNIPCDADPNYIRKNIGIMNTDTLTNLRKEVENYSNVFLKMDIENCEWDWINFMDYDTLNKFKMIVIELHFYMHGVDDVEMFEKLSALKKLQKTHRLVHVHGNNCSPCMLEFGPYKFASVSEFTFVRKEYASDEFSTTKLPIDGLDFKNEPTKDDIPFINIHSSTV